MNESQRDKVEALEVLMDRLTAKDKVFAESLVRQAARKTLSDRQMFFVEVLIERVMSPPISFVAEKANVGDFSVLMSFFEGAKANLKFPKLYLAVEGVPVILSLAGPASKEPGTVNVSGVGAFGARAWYGRVDRSGNWTKGSKQYEEIGEVEALLKAFSKDPGKAAKEYGDSTGRCCFCGSELTDERSLAAGFGPVCAKNWNLMGQYKNAISTLKSS